VTSPKPLRSGVTHPRLAVVAGGAVMELDTPQGHVKDASKYLVVWRKVNGSWKMA
jgi:hypothetical protein